jgi:hypothetical protein
MQMSDGPSRARSFLSYWALRDTNLLARQPDQVVEGMDAASRQVIYVGIEDLLDEVTTRDAVSDASEQLTVYLDPGADAEFRWQLALMIADNVVIRRPRWEPDAPFQPSLRSLCELEAPVASSEIVNHEFEIVNHEFALDPKIDAELVEMLDALDENEGDYITSQEEQKNARLPGALARALKFIAHLAAVGESANLVIAEPDIDAGREVVNSLEGVYYYDGTWFVHDSWIGGDPPPAGIETFGEVLSGIQHRSNLSSELDEVFGSYASGLYHPSGHLPLVPLTDVTRRIATEFYCRFKRLYFGHSLVETGPRAVPVAAPGTDASSPDWRPALSDEMMLTAFPGIATADLSAFEYLHNLPRLEEFRRRLRLDAERVENFSAADLAVRMQEIARELQDAGERARKQYDDLARNDRMNLALTWIVNALTIGAGYISFGPPGAIAGGAISASLLMALQRKMLDPTARFSGSELALLTLSKSALPS